jgi:hypothetical protein
MVAQMPETITNEEAIECINKLKKYVNQNLEDDLLPISKSNFLRVLSVKLTYFRESIVKGIYK